MSIARLVALGAACLLGGILIGYVFWGQRVRDVRDELARAQQAHLQVEAELGAARAQLKKAGEELNFERQRRERVELLLSEGRK